MTDQNTNPDYYKDELYLDEDFRMLAKTYPADVSAIGVTTLIDYVEAVEAELARRTKEMHYANTVCMEQRQELARRDEELALTEKKLCNIDRSAREEIARRDEIITRLKEDGERLVKHFVVVDPDDGINECIQCNGSDYLQENNVLVHMPDCPITLHRALMKELNQTGELK